MSQPRPNSSKPTIKYLAEFKRQNEPKKDSKPRWTRLMDGGRSSSGSKTVILSDGGRCPSRENRRRVDLQLERWSPDSRYGYWTLEHEGKRYVVGYSPTGGNGGGTAKWHKVDLRTGEFKDHIVAYTVPRNQPMSPSATSSDDDEELTDQSSSSEASVSPSSYRSTPPGANSPPHTTSSDVDIVSSAERITSDGSLSLYLVSNLLMNVSIDQEAPGTNHCRVRITRGEMLSPNRSTSKRPATSMSDTTRVPGSINNTNKRPRISYLDPSCSNSVSYAGDTLNNQTEGAVQARTDYRLGNPSARPDKASSLDRQDDAPVILRVHLSLDPSHNFHDVEIGNNMTSKDFFDIISTSHNGEIVPCDVAKVTFNWASSHQDLVQIFVYKDDHSSFEFLMQVLQAADSWRSPTGSRCLGTVHLEQTLTRQYPKARQKFVEHCKSLRILI